MFTSCHITILDNSKFFCFTKSSMFLPCRNILVSSAKRIVNSNVDVGQIIYVNKKK